LEEEEEVVEEEAEEAAAAFGRRDWALQRAATCSYSRRASRIHIRAASPSKGVVVVVIVVVVIVCSGWVHHCMTYGMYLLWCECVPVPMFSALVDRELCIVTTVYTYVVHSLTLFYTI
jgi:hypothetical protein